MSKKFRDLCTKNQTDIKFMLSTFLVSKLRLDCLMYNFHIR